MRALIQRVSQASIVINKQQGSSIDQGFVVFVGIGEGDSHKDADSLLAKISKLRIMSDRDGKTNLSLLDVGGSALIVSQFTLYANCRKGNRPSFTQAAPPTEAIELYNYFVKQAQQLFPHVETGEFGADMQVSLVNDGPFTIWLDTAEL